MSKINFPLTVEAAQAGEKAQWKLGDALAKEAEETLGGSRGLKAVVAELERIGIEYSTGYLADLRRTAVAFPRNRRLDLPFKVHAEAGNPDTLDVIVKTAKKTGSKVTIWYVGDALREMREAASEARREKADAARKEAEAHEREEAKAKERQLKAKDADERARAKADVENARNAKRVAREKQKQAKALPKRSDRPAPTEEELPTMVLVMGIKTAANEARRLAEKASKSLGSRVVDLSPVQIAALTDAALTTAKAWNDFAAEVRKATNNKRGHLSVVGE